MRRALLVLGLLLVGTVIHSAAAQDDFRWSGRVADGKAIEIKGVNGSIRAEPASGDQVEVVAAKSARTSDLSSVQIEVLQHNGGVTICAVYPTPRRARVDAALRMTTLPTTVRMSAGPARKGA